MRDLPPHLIRLNLGIRLAYVQAEFFIALDHSPGWQLTPPNDDWLKLKRVTTVLW
jgi:hypothetical protein